MNSKQREKLQRISNAISVNTLPNGMTLVSNTLSLEDIKQIINEVLAEPLRNCDVGTAEEQKARYEAFCKECQRITRDYPCDFDHECIFKWAQMPYKDESKWKDYSNVGAVCFECAKKAGFKFNKTAASAWTDKCGICHEQKPCTNLWRDWKPPKKNNKTKTNNGE